VCLAVSDLLPPFSAGSGPVFRGRCCWFRVGRFFRRRVRRTGHTRTGGFLSQSSGSLRIGISAVLLSLAAMTCFQLRIAGTPWAQSGAPALFEPPAVSNPGTCPALRRYGRNEHLALRHAEPAFAVLVDHAAEILVDRV
jgi:hypothetical protein